MKKAILVYPKFSGETFWSLRKNLELHVPKNEFGFIKSQSPPSGLLSVGRVFKKHYNVVLLDRNVDPRNSSLKKLIADKDVYFVAIGGMFGQEEDALFVASVAKQFKKPLVIGGPFVERKILEKEPLKSMKVIVVDGEAELVIDNVLNDLANKKFGTYYEGKHCLSNEFLLPDFSLINPNNYLTMNVQCSRGCPFNCEFCDITARFGKGPRYTPEEKIRKQFRQLYSLGWRGSIFIVDDNLTAYNDLAIESLKSIRKIEKEIGYKFPKITQVSLELSDNNEKMKEIRKLLYETNFTLLFIGVETNNIDSLKETGKIQNLRGERTLKEKISFISKETKAGIMLGIIYGFDHDTLESAKSLVDFINSLPCASIMAGTMKVGPRTLLWDRLKKEGRLKEESIGSGNNSDGIFNFIPYNFSVQEGEKKFVEIQKGIYNEKAYFTRLMNQLIIAGPHISTPKFSILDGLYSVISILIKEKSRMYRKHFPEALRIARKRFGLLKPMKMGHLLAMYLAMCSKYTHTTYTIDYLEGQVRNRKYGEWEKHSWKEMQKK